MPWLAACAQRALHVAANPPLLKPSEVAQLPQGRVDGGDLRHYKIDSLKRFLILPK